MITPTIAPTTRPMPARAIIGHIVLVKVWATH
jgi:hypothetical protein